jgi:hypothetical protein
LREGVEFSAIGSNGYFFQSGRNQLNAVLTMLIIILPTSAVKKPVAIPPSMVNPALSQLVMSSIRALITRVKRPSVIGLR